MKILGEDDPSVGWTKNNIGNAFKGLYKVPCKRGRADEGETVEKGGAREKRRLEWGERK